MTRAVVNTGQSGGGILARLARDVRAAALAWMCIAVIPFCGMVGGGVDIARMYITKTRLQHACDAGALAGRKQMGSGTWNTDDLTAANRFFDANYRTGAYGTNSLTRSFRENAGKVTGTASATVPMTLMRVLGRRQETLSVSCDSEMRLPNTDIMFVLDTTGSMASKAVSTDPQNKIDGLKTAVKCFYEIVARLDITDANCTTGNPSGGTGNQVQIRFGFVPYSTNVNVGHLLKPEWMADNWLYQTRVGRWWVVAKVNEKRDVPASKTGVYQWQCNDANAALAGYNTDEVTYTNNDGIISAPFKTGTRRRVKHYEGHVTGWSSTNNTCSGYQTRIDIESILTEGAIPTGDDEWEDWRYAKQSQDIRGLKNGTGWNSGVDLWIGNNGTKRTLDWDGCIEERPTVLQNSYTPIPTGAYDLDVDMIPTAGNSNSLWGPALNDAIYLRAATTSYYQLNNAQVLTKTNYANGGSYYCPTESKKLQLWPNADDFKNYVNSLVPTGNTYHDIGMLWGARLMSPTGIFASENAYTPQGGEIDRHLIFMTDGDAQSAPCDYAAYGLPWFDKRTTTDVGSANDCQNTRGALNDQINARLSALCTVVKNKNITLWVISFGSGSNTATETRLSNCATPGRYFVARDSATLQATFASIANQISQLRLTQ